MAQLETKGSPEWQPIQAPEGMFFCEGCLEDKAEVERSPDPRYCLECYQFLLQEAKLHSSRRNAEWMPRIGLETLAKPLERASGCNKIPDHDNHRAGRPKANVSVQKVAQFKAQGCSLRDIAKQLGVSHMTVCRTLKKARQQ